MKKIVPRVLLLNPYKNKPFDKVLQLGHEEYMDYSIHLLTAA